MPNYIDPSMPPVLKAIEKYLANGGTVHRLGVAAGYSPHSASQSVRQFMRRGDPCISTLRRFCDALDLQMHEVCR